IAFGYDINSTAFLDRAKARARDNLAITLVVDHEQTSLDLLSRGWPRTNPPNIYVADSSRLTFPHAKMHSKLLLIDGSDLLITSANFTYHGLSGNVEMGVRMRGAK